MIRLNQRRLIIPRGDTGSFTIPSLRQASNADVAIFTIFNCMTHTKMFEKAMTIVDNTLTMEFSHNDTVNLNPGKYVWDIKFYKNPQYADEQLINGDEIDSFYAGFSLPECEIRETGDSFLFSPDAPTGKISPNDLDIITAALNEAAEAVRRTEENVEHYPQVIDNYWYVWDATTDAFVSTGVSAIGPGIVTGGTTGQVLVKKSNADYDTEWIDLIDPTVPAWAKEANKPAYTAAEVGALADTLKGAANGLAELDNNGKVPSSQLPSYVDDVLEYPSHSSFPATGESGKIYIALDTNVSYRWGGSSYVEVGSSLALGETASTAYRGDRGAAAYAAAVTDVDSAPTADSTHLVTSQGIYNALSTKSAVSATAIQQLGMKIATITVDNTPVDIYIPEIATEYNSNSSYYYGNMVVYDGKTYLMSQQQGVATGEWNSNYWTEHTVGDIAGTAYMVALGCLPAINMVTASIEQDFFDTSSTYNPTDLVWYNDILYECTTTHKGAWNASHFKAVTIADILNAKDWDATRLTQYYNQHALQKIAVPWITTGNYSTGDYVVYNGEVYCSLTGETGADPSNDTTNWKHCPPVHEVSVSPVLNSGTKIATIDINGTNTDLYTPDISDKADKTDTVLNTHLSINRAPGTTAGNGSIAAGNNATASGSASFATGLATSATGAYSAAFGSYSSASSSAAHAEGTYSTASGANAHAEGSYTSASDHAAHAEGTRTNASGLASHAEGSTTAASGAYSHAGGFNTKANAYNMTAIGHYNIADTLYSTWAANTHYSVDDKVSYNGTGYICVTDNTDVDWTSSHWQALFTNSEQKTAFVIGNGESNNSRSNAFAINWDGDVFANKDIYVNCNDDGTGGSKVATAAALSGLSSAVNMELTQLNDTKLNAPSTAGTNGQVLTSNGNGGQSWQTPASGVSEVTVTPIQSAGQKIATINVDSTNTDVYIPEIAEEYDPSQTYTFGSVVLHEGQTYLYPRQQSITGSWDASQWQAMPVGMIVGGALGLFNAIQMDLITMDNMIASKLNAPSTAGTSGQVLTSNGNGGQSWQTIDIGPKIAQDFSEETWYAMGDIVIHNGKTYQCTVGLEQYTHGQWDESCWQEYTLGDITAETYKNYQTYLMPLVEALDGTMQTKQDAPSAHGTAGQVLSLDNSLYPVWRTINAGNTVTVTPIQATGEKIATISVDGTSSDIYTIKVASDFDTSLTYPFGAMVQKDGKTYMALTMSTIGPGAWDSSQWYELTLGEAVTNIFGSLFEFSGALNDKITAPSTAGTQGQVLTINSNGSPIWATPASSGAAIDDTAGDGDTTVTWSANKIFDELATKVGPTDYANSSTGGVVKIMDNAAGGLGITNQGYICFSGASEPQIKAGTTSNLAPPVSRQHMAVFYGLAKAAGDTTQASSANTVGTYTSEAKAAIQTMLGINMPTKTSDLTNDSYFVSASFDGDGLVLATATAWAEGVSF